MDLKTDFLDRQRDQAVARVKEIDTLWSRVTEMVFGNAGRVSVVTDVISLTPDCHVAEITRMGGAGDRVWTTVIFGEHKDPMNFDSVDLAVLHLIARRHGAKKDMGTAAAFAARVLAVPATDQ